LFKLRAWQSFCTTSFHVLFGLPLGLEPSTSYSRHFFTQSVSSFRNTRPYQCNLFCCSLWRIRGKVIRTVLCCVRQLYKMVHIHTWAGLTGECRFKFRVAAWRSGNVVGRINEVALRRARLVLGWVTVFSGQTTSVFHQATQANSASYPQRDGKWVPAKVQWCCAAGK